MAACSDEAMAAGFDAEDDVLGDGEGRHQHEVLVDHAHAERDRRGGVAQHAGPPADQELAGGGLFQALEQLHPCGLARAVLPDDRPDLARRDLEVHPAHRAHTVGVRLGDRAGCERPVRPRPMSRSSQGRSGIRERRGP